MEKNRAIENMLNSLDGIQQASAGHFFYTRVQARLQKEEISLWGRVAAFITKPSVALATLFLICLLNTAALLYRQDTYSASAVSDQVDQPGNDEYNTTLAANTYYEENSEAR